MRIPTELVERPVGHTHFWDRAMAAGVSRGQFLRRGAAAVGGLAGLSMLGAVPAFAAGSDPNPIAPNPNLFGFRVYLPGAGNEPSTITDLNGFVGITEMTGTGEDGDGETLNYGVDMRFMKGLYRGMDGRLRQGAFAFV